MSEFNRLDIWVGHFGTRARLYDEFLEEVYRDDDDEPISEFARTQGETFYDHDFLEAHYKRDGYAPDTPIIPPGFAFAHDDELKARAQLEQQLPEPFNTKLFVFGEQFENPRSCSGAGYALRYLGRFATKAC